MKKIDIVLYIVCLIALALCIYSLTQISAIEEKYKYEMEKIINNSPCNPNRYNSNGYTILPINLSGVK